MVPDSQNSRQSNAYFIILSGTYCTTEVAAEFGSLPPSLLPIGHSRLIYRQIEMARRCNAQPVLSLPADYEVPLWDAKRLGVEGVRIVQTPATLSLNQAVQFVLEILDACGPLYILYGDTFIDMENMAALDQAASEFTDSNYNWAEVDTCPDGALTIVSGYGDGGTKRSVLCGFFSFSDAAVLRNACVKSPNFDFTVMTYARARSMRIQKAKEWYDFGHLSLIYRSRRHVMVSRAFNDIRSDGDAIIKTSHDVSKISAEAAWFQSIPEALKPFTPHFMGYEPERSGYRLEYLYLPTLAELFTFGELPPHVWHKILNDCCTFLKECRRHRPPIGHPAADSNFAPRFFKLVFQDRTRQRVEAFQKARNWSQDMPVEINGTPMQPLAKVCNRLLSYIQVTKPHNIAFWHGDFFFGNIFYDFRAARVRVIDPRGTLTKGEQSVYGDYRYDLAKMAHSIIGGYDFLLARHADLEEVGVGRFRFEQRPTPLQSAVIGMFENMEIDGQPIVTDEIRAMTALLFITMLPLHADDRLRQDLLLCNGLRLANELFEKKGELE